jgi:hypothetical protein
MRLPLLALIAFSATRAPAATLFSNLGNNGSVYSTNTTNPDDSYAVEANGPSFQFWQLSAFEFTVSGTGNFELTEIDLGVTNLSAPDTFTASIWTNNNGAPGSELAGASWNLATTVKAGHCCGLTSEKGITNVTLVGGQDYWMVLGPQNSNDGSFNLWMATTKGSDVTGLFSPDGGSSWQSNGYSALPGAFDVIGTAEEASTPEPQALYLTAPAIAALLLLKVGRASAGFLRKTQPLARPPLL